MRNDGYGGSYRIDPESGERVLIERTIEPGEQIEPPVPSDTTTPDPAE